ncbi:hypothetical protein [Brevibacillus fulvus]|nr:hypothetical protein [Brevibacillus fulvus]
MRKSMMFLLIGLLLLCPYPVGAQEAASLEQLILQQHLTQKELERSLTLLKQEESTLLKETAQLDLELKKQSLVIEAMRRHAGEVARAYYTGERASFLSLLFDTENFNQFLMVFDFLQLLYQRDLDKLEKFQEERAKAAQLQEDKRMRLTEIQELRRQFESRLAEKLAVQKAKEDNLAQLSDATGTEALMDHLMEDWQQRGLPAFQTFFQVLSKVMFQIPELATPDRIHSEDWFTHTLTIKQDEFNEFLASKDDLFKQAEFAFEDNQLIVNGSYNQMNIRIVGEYQLVSPQELKFHIISLFFDGFQLPQSTIEEMEKTYNLSFYPSLISSNIEVKSISLDNQQLKLQLKVDLPFGFSLK